MMSGEPSSAAMPSTLPTTGDVIDGKYVLERLLGRGGMGAVYAARHRKLGHLVAIKVMLADAANHEAASRFVNEGRAAANIQNEHVVRVSDVDEENGYAYMVLELLEGEDLAQVLERERRLPWNVAVAYVLQALDGVRQAHAQGIVHRDLKPSNLFLARRQDGASVVKVLDFGISKAGGSNPLGASPGALTSTKAMLGSPLYMSPEQLRSSKSVDARADIWATGVILYELMTGTLPFLGDNLGELFAQILEVDAPPLRAIVPDAPPVLEAIVGRCLQRRPEHRFQNVDELVRELTRIEGAAALPAALPQTAMMLDAPYVAGLASAPRLTPAPMMSASSAPQMPLPPMSASPPPGTHPGPARRWASTPGSSGAGTGAPLVTGTVPIGATTPQPYRQSGGTWQPPTNAAPKKALAVVGALVFVGLAGVGIAYTARRPKPDAVSSGVAPAPPSLASADVAPIQPAPAPPASATSAAAVAVVPAASSGASSTMGASPPPRPFLPPKASGPKGAAPKVQEAGAKPPEPAPKAPEPVARPVASPKVDPPKTVQQSER